MNKELIRKIAQQATQECIKESIKDKTAPAWRYEDAVVRIVIKRCNDVIAKEYLNMNVGSDWEDGKMCGLISASNLLLEHFILQDRQAEHE